MANGPYISSSEVASSVPFDNVAAPTFTSTDVQSALKEIRDQIVHNSATQATTTNGNLTLTTSSNTTQIFTGTATGYSVQLPNATSLPLSIEFELFNTTTQSIQIKDATGVNLFSLSQNSIGRIVLQLNGTAAGAWIYYQTGVNTATGIISYYIISSIAFATSANVDTMITGFSVVPQSGTYAVWFNASETGTGSGQQMTSTIYNGALPIADSIRNAVTPSGLHIINITSQTIAQFNGTNAVSVYVNANGSAQIVNQRSLLLIRLGT